MTEPALSEVRLDDGRIPHHLARQPFGHPAPVVEDDEAVDGVDDRVHGVLDDHDRHAPVAHAADQGHHRLHAVAREPGQRLVGQGEGGGGGGGGGEAPWGGGGGGG